MQHDHFQMPDEFFEKFGGRSFKSRFSESDFTPRNSNYKDSRTAQREMEELRIQREVEELNKKAKYPLPTFEQLLQQEQNRRRAEAKTSSMMVTLGTVCLFLLAAFASRTV